MTLTEAYMFVQTVVRGSGALLLLGGTMRADAVLVDGQVADFAAVSGLHHNQTEGVIIAATGLSTGPHELTIIREHDVVRGTFAVVRGAPPDPQRPVVSVMAECPNLVHLVNGATTRELLHWPPFALVNWSPRGNDFVVYAGDGYVRLREAAGTAAASRIYTEDGFVSTPWRVRCSPDTHRSVPLPAGAYTLIHFGKVVWRQGPPSSVSLRRMGYLRSLKPLRNAERQPRELNTWP